ncbi:tRNA(Ile)-lysidine synthase TilS/MesJ [Methanococcus voltae PS]|uniref:tRNA(Ile)-lysidine synthase TilS/MesJ n=2 Tax=Methanococcus voltae TaxID=2188 RepID=A0ABT2EUR1_METVO|nr:tRNA(Ile)-lysidine synthase TilS/MesJ [Methanococcus voltae]MCS3921693.1 tRNA(Ile)-lysidine synthase TilS/MesJ [Methanococcus voltae PS]
MDDATQNNKDNIKKDKLNKIDKKYKLSTELKFAKKTRELEEFGAIPYNKYAECELCIHTSETRPMYEYNGKKFCIECINALRFPRNFEKMSEELFNHLRVQKQKNNKYDCILGFSGGKDSVVALYLLVNDLKLKPLCVTVDNGYMADEAMENCKNIAKYFKVDWLVLNRDYTKFFNKMIERGESPCRICSDMNMHELWHFARQTNITTIVTGHELPFGTTALRNMKKDITLVRLLVGYKLSEKERYEILDNLPWNKPDLGGYTTNCLVLGYALQEFYKRRNISFEYDRVSAMIRYGLMTKEEALSSLECPEVPLEVLKELKNRGLNVKIEKVEKSNNI